jgi:hypothetical protein
MPSQGNQSRVEPHIAGCLHEVFYEIALGKIKSQNQVKNRKVVIRMRKSYETPLLRKVSIRRATAKI